MTFPGVGQLLVFNNDSLLIWFTYIRKTCHMQAAKLIVTALSNLLSVDTITLLLISIYHIKIHI